MLGANDGIVSTASLIIGVAAASSTHESIVLAGLAGLVAGAVSMAAGEYVSVCSQADTLHADLAIEQESLDNDYEFEVNELTEIYRGRGLNADLARQVALALMAHDALGAHARDEIGIVDTAKARPVQAAMSSMVTFTVGAALPLWLAWWLPLHQVISIVALGSLAFLAVLGGLAAFAGGASVTTGAARVVFWGALAMGLTAAVGGMFGIVI